MKSPTTDLERERSRIGMTIEQALEDEWGKGVAEQRGGDATLPFVGDALVHLHDQLLGALNYRRQVGRDDDIASKMLHDLGVEKQLIDLVYTLRAIYQLREKRRLRVAGEVN